MPTSPVQLPRVTGPRSPPLTEENQPAPVHLARGKRIICFAHAHAHTRTLAHMRAHTDPSPRQASLQGLELNSQRVPRDCPGPMASAVLPLPTSKWPTPEATFRAPHPKRVLLLPEPCLAGSRPPPPPGHTTRCRRQAPPVSLGSRWSPGPRERTQGQRAERGPQARWGGPGRDCDSWKGTVLLPPLPSAPRLGVPAYPSSQVPVGRRARGGPGGKNEIWAGRGGNFSEGRERPVSPEDRARRAALPGARGSRARGASGIWKGTGAGSGAGWEGTPGGGGSPAPLYLALVQSL